MRGITRSGGVSIAYQAVGSGPPLLLIVGLGGRSADWGDHFIEALARRHRVVTFDNRGTGESDKPRNAWTLEDMAGDALAVLDALEIERAHVFGHSMGGMIAQLVALDHPARVDKLVLVCTHFGGSSLVHPKPELLSIFQPLRGTPVAEITRTAMGRIMASEFVASHPEAIERLVENAVRWPTPKAAFTAQLAALIGSDRSARVAGIKAPTLVVHGAVDPLIPVENGVALAGRIPGARLEILPGVGHIPTWESPGRLIELVGEFISS